MDETDVLAGDLCDCLVNFMLGHRGLQMCRWSKKRQPPRTVPSDCLNKLLEQIRSNHTELCSSAATINSLAKRLSERSGSVGCPRSHRTNWWTIKPAAMLAE